MISCTLMSLHERNSAIWSPESGWPEFWCGSIGWFYMKLYLILYLIKSVTARAIGGLFVWIWNTFWWWETENWKRLDFLDLLEASWICDVQHRSNKYEAFLDFDFFRSLYIRNDDERMTVWYYSLFRLVFFITLFVWNHAACIIIE